MKNILLTLPEHKIKVFHQRYYEYNIQNYQLNTNIYDLPILRLQVIADFKDILQSLLQFDYLVFNSSYGVQCVFDNLLTADISSKILSIGHSVTTELKKYNINIEYQSIHNYSLKALYDEYIIHLIHTPAKIAIITNQSASSDIYNIPDCPNIHFIPLYKSIPLCPLSESVMNFHNMPGSKYIILTSGLGVLSFVNYIQRHGLKTYLNNCEFIVMGNHAYKECQKYFGDHKITQVLNNSYEAIIEYIEAVI